MISRELVAATRRAAELAETALAAEGEEPPQPYVVLVLGSAGRGESLLALDQDNAIVFGARRARMVARTITSLGSARGSRTRSTQSAFRIARAASWDANPTGAAAPTPGGGGLRNGSRAQARRICCR